MRVYPVNILLEGKPCTVVGGGVVAARKVEGLLDAGALVTVISPDVCERILGLVEVGSVRWIKATWSRELADGAAIIVVATDDESANRRVAADARSLRIPVNVADMPEECDFILPSVFRRGSVTIAVGTGGLSPALSAHLSRKLQTLVGAEYGMAAEVLGKLRKVLEAKKVSARMRRDIFNELVKSGLAEALRDKDGTRANELLQNIVGKYIDVSGILGELN